jgi:hypothetical protein
MHHPAQHNHLVSERSIFGFKSAVRLKWRDQDGQDKTKQRDHCALTLGDSLPQSIRMRFSVHTEVAITNLPVSPGDTMYCLICVNSTTTATVYISNQSSGVSTRFTITAPSGTKLVGNSAEWIVERPTVNGSLANLSDYKVDYFDEGIAGASDIFRIVTLGSGTAVTMTGNNSAPLSVPTLETDQLMKVNWLKAN